MISKQRVILTSKVASLLGKKLVQCSITSRRLVTTLQPANRGQPSNHQGDWWIGGAEKPAVQTHGKPEKCKGDSPQGTLTSASFLIKGPTISFLIGGGCNEAVARAELIVNNEVRIKNHC